MKSSSYFHINTQIHARLPPNFINLCFYQYALPHNFWAQCCSCNTHSMPCNLDTTLGPDTEQTQLEMYFLTSKVLFYIIVFTNTLCYTIFWALFCDYTVRSCNTHSVSCSSNLDTTLGSDMEQSLQWKPTFQTCWEQ